MKDVNKKENKEENKYSLILASNSPRRKELLGWLDIPFKIKGADIEEISHEENPKDLAIDLAVQKGEAVWNELGQEYGDHPFLISSDTIVVLDKRVYGKPTSKEDAREMLMSLSDKEHKVITSVYIKAKSINSNEVLEKKFAIETDVTFSEITQDLIEPYLESEESMDKAGAYGIQGKGLVFVKSIKGSYSNVVGFPLVEFIEEFRKLICEDNESELFSWRKKFNI